MFVYIRTCGNESLLFITQNDRRRSFNDEHAHATRQASAWCTRSNRLIAQMLVTDDGVLPPEWVHELHVIYIGCTLMLDTCATAPADSVWRREPLSAFPARGAWPKSPVRSDDVQELVFDTLAMVAMALDAASLCSDAVNTSSEQHHSYAQTMWCAGECFALIERKCRDTSISAEMRVWLRQAIEAVTNAIASGMIAAGDRPSDSSVIRMLDELVANLKTEN